MQTAIITGITGQDGSYLTELLLGKGYAVHGLVRRSSSIERPRLDHLTLDPSIYGERLFLHYADLTDVTTIRRILTSVQPDEFYHLAGQSHVGISFDIPETTCEFTAMGTLRLLEILRDLTPQPKFLNIGSSEIFGHPFTSPQDEQTPMRAVSPYGVAKAFAVQIVRVYRESFGMFACNAICYNHESPRRGRSFVTRKITRGAAMISKGLQEKLVLGNIDSCRDWGFAGEYVDAMWRMMQHSSPDDFVIATGVSTSVREFLGYAFEHVGLDWRDYVETGDRFFRRADAQSLVGNPEKAANELGWKAAWDVSTLARKMVDADLGRC